MTRNDTKSNVGEASEAAFVIGGIRVPASRIPPGLHPVATPIGNLEDIGLRALRTLAAADIVYCEDTRTTRHLFSRFGISRALRAYHDHNAASVRAEILKALGAGLSVALVSDAGTPLISDPGFKLVRDAAAAGHAITPVPGPSAMLAAAVASGLPTDQLHFAGFLPAKSGARRKAIGALADITATLVMFEAPSRAGTALADLAELLGPRPAALARELTKLHEETIRGPLDDLAAYFKETPPRGEVVIIVGGAEAQAAEDADIDILLAEALETASLRDAVASVTTRTGRKKREVYARALAITGDPA